jgi:TolB-like protein
MKTWLRRSTTPLLLTLLTLTSGGILCVEESSPVTILILPFDNATADPELDGATAGIPDLITAFLVPGSELIRVVDRDALEAIFNEASLDWQKVTTAPLEKRRLLLANVVLRGSISGTAQHLRLQLFLHDLETTRLLESLELDGRATELLTLCKKASERLAVAMKVELEPQPELEVDGDPEVSLAMLQGLGHFHNGDPAAAVSRFFDVLELDANHEAGRYWLARSFIEAGMKGHARIEMGEYSKRFPDHPRAADLRERLEK